MIVDLAGYDVPMNFTAVIGNDRCYICSEATTECNPSDVCIYIYKTPTLNFIVNLNNELYEFCESHGMRYEVVYMCDPSCWLCCE